jgi:hypothetical protein
MKGEGPTYAAQPSQEDRPKCNTVHVVQEKVLFISHLHVVYSTLEYSEIILFINKVHLAPLLVPLRVYNLYCGGENRGHCDEIAGLVDFRPDQNGGLWLATFDFLEATTP